MQDDKYVVFKIGDWLDFWKEFPDSPDTEHLLTPLQRKRLDDAVVIRRQDVFAPPALDAYANCIMVVLETEKAINGNTKLAQRLQNIADYFHTQAAEAWQADRKVPD